MRGGGIMSDNITKRVGLGTAYGFAKAGGYEGTVAEFTELLGNIAIDLARIENLSVTVTTLPAGSQATASLNGSVLSLGIPKGDKGDKGNTGNTGASAGFGTVSATVDDTIGTPSVEVTASGADTAKNFAFAFHNLKGQKGDKGDTGEVSEAELAEALEDFSENGTVANAEQLTTKIRANDQTPYLFRTSGGSVDIGDREYINGIVGGTMAFNQLAYNGDFASFVGWGYPSTDYRNMVSDNGWAKIAPANNQNYVQFCTNAEFYSKAEFIQGHKYFTSFEFDSNISITRVAFAIFANWAQLAQNTMLSPTTKGTLYGVVSASGSSSQDARICVTCDGSFVGNSSYIRAKNVMVIDLTLMFGSTIADYIYSLEQANAGAGVAFFKSLFPKPYYAYNSGELMSVKGLVSHDMVGFNAFDKSTVVDGYIQDDTGEMNPMSGYKCTDFINVVPNQTYYIKSSQTNGMWGAWYDADKNYISGVTGYANTTIVAPTNAYYVRLTMATSQGGNPDTFCINLSWDGSEDGNYEPYQKWSYPLDSDLELRGIPKLDASNNLYYDGDVYESDGTVTRKYGVISSSDLTVGTYSAPRWKLTLPNDAPLHYPTDSSIAGNMACSYPFDIIRKSAQSNNTKYSLSYSDTTTTNAFILTLDPDSITTEAQAQTWVANHPFDIVYELATPTTETADPYTNPQIVNDFGTEEWVLDSDVFPIPVGHNTDYPIDLKAQVEMMPHSPDGDGDYIVRQTNGTNEYVALANNATIQNILSRLEALEG